MARSRTPTAEKSHYRSDAKPHSNGDNRPAEDGTQDWVTGPLTAPKQAVDSLLEMQCQWLKTASMGSETLAIELKELQQAKDPMQFMVAQFSLANQQLEIVTRQLAAAMQQLYDAQLLWLGQFDSRSEELRAKPALDNPGQSVLEALGKVQDDWLKVTQNWIDTIHTGNNAR